MCVLMNHQLTAAERVCTTGQKSLVTLFIDHCISLRFNKEHPYVAAGDEGD